MVSLMMSASPACLATSSMWCSAPTGGWAKHTASIFIKLDLEPSDDDNRRVLAVLACLNG
jgi:hypothetical protein